VLFNYFILRSFSSPNLFNGLDPWGPNTSLDNNIGQIDLCHIWCHLLHWMSNAQIDVLCIIWFPLTPFKSNIWYQSVQLILVSKQVLGPQLSSLLHPCPTNYKMPFLLDAALLQNVILAVYCWGTERIKNLVLQHP
jgi:hypothetical protein